MPPIEVQDTDLLLVQRDNQTYKATASDLNLSGNKPINPSPDDITITPPTTGNGTEGAPYILTSPPCEYGKTVSTYQTVTFSNQAPGNLVVFTDLNADTNGERYTQPVGIIPPSGEHSIQLVFTDTPASDTSKDFFGSLTIGTLPVYFRWEVNIRVAPSIDSVTLVGTGTDESKRFEDQSFASNITLTEGSPISTKSIGYKVSGTLFEYLETSEIIDSDSTTLTFADNTDLDKFSNGLSINQNSGGAPETSAITNVVQQNEAWDTYNTGIGSGWLRVATDDADTYVAVGNGAMTGPGATTNVLMSSTDGGVTWANRISSSTPILDVAYGNGIWVAIQPLVPNTTSCTFYTSSDGINWTTTVRSGGSNVDYSYSKTQSIAFGGGQFVCVSNYGQSILTAKKVIRSTNGTSWTEEYGLYNESGQPNDGNAWNDIQYGGGKFVAVCPAGGTSGINEYHLGMWSTDGINWNRTLSKQGTPIQGSSRFYHVQYAQDSNSEDEDMRNGMWVTGSNVGTTAAYSTDGALTWQAGTTSVAPNNPQGFAYGGGKWIYSARYNVLQSTNGKNWTVLSPTFLTNPSSGPPNGLVYGDTHGFCVVTQTEQASNVYMSLTGDTYAELTLTDNTNLANLRVGDTITETGGDGTGTVNEVGATSLTLGSPGGTWSNGSTVTGPNIPAATGTVGSVDASGNTITLSATGSDRWLVTKPEYEESKKLNKTATAVRIVDDATAYLETNSSREVTGTSFAPVYYETFDTTDEITFNLNPGTGRTWDKELPDGTTIQACVYADNTAFGGGRSPETGTIDSNVLQPEAVLGISDLFSTTLYTGNSSTQTVTNGIDLAGEGGLVWIKNRNIYSKEHVLTDTARGISGYALSTNNNAAALTYEMVTAFNSDGFSVNNLQSVNESNVNYASWTFRKAPGFFDVQTYDGTGVSGREIPHNLNSTPGMIIVKRLNGADNWTVQHSSLGATKSLYLNLTNAEDVSASEWDNTNPNSSTFTVGTSGKTNQSTDQYVAYLFAENTPELIKCGSYTGTAALQNINCGFKAAWVMVKCSSDAADWVISDDKRGNYVQLYPNESQAEQTGTSGISFGGANGFTVDAGTGTLNASDRTYVYVAIAAPVVRSLTQSEVNATKLLFETTDHRRCKYMCDITARAAELRDEYEAKGYTTHQLNTLLNEDEHCD